MRLSVGHPVHRTQCVPPAGGRVTPRFGAPGHEPPLAKARSRPPRCRHDQHSHTRKHPEHASPARRPRRRRNGRHQRHRAATARRLASDGASVALVGRREERLRALAAELGDSTDADVIRAAVDVSDRDAVERAAEAIRDELGRVDLVVANAGVMLPAPFEEADTGRVGRDARHERARPALHGPGLHRRPARHRRRRRTGGPRARRLDRGHMVFPNYGVYGATKAAVAHLTRNLRAELGPRGVRVKNVEPGLVRTELAATTRRTPPSASLSPPGETRSARCPPRTSPTRSPSPWPPRRG